MRLIQLGFFESPEQFIQVAARNQLVYELGNSRSPDLGSVARTAMGSFGGDVGGNGKAAPRATGKAHTVAEWPLAFQLRDPEEQLPEPGAAALARDDERVGGLINRIFPIKLSLRFLANAAVGKNEWAEVTTISKQLSAAAAALGSHLDRLDERGQRRRDDLLATGLPRVDNNGSCDRFFTQFVARTTRDGRVYPAAIFQYGLAANVSGRAALTPLGIEFSEMRNPILDAGTFESTLTDDERTFFVRSVVPQVPAESRDFKRVLAAVRAGHTSPETLMATLAETLRAEEAIRKWTDVMMRSHVSGVVSRMVDLRLLRRSWGGRRVTYEIGELEEEGIENVHDAGVRQAHA